MRILFVMPRVPKKILPQISNSEETIGERIARIRKLRGLTQRQLANRIGIAQNLISDYENSKIRLYDEMVARLAKALKISSDEILGIKLIPREPMVVSRRFINRLTIIETFPETQKKRVLRNLDDAIDSYTQRMQSP